jgi:hypothetical protein
MVERLIHVAPDTPLPAADVERFLDELARDADLDLDDILNALHEAEAAALEADEAADRSRVTTAADASIGVAGARERGTRTRPDAHGPGLRAAAHSESEDEATDVGAAAYAAGAWTAARLMTVLRALAADDAAAFEDAMRTFVARARALAAGAEREAAEARDEIDRMRRERLLPGAREMDLIIRYESALNRMLYQAINQLESAQARRNGAPVALPLRLQHYGGRNG